MRDKQTPIGLKVPCEYCSSITGLWQFNSNYITCVKCNKALKVDTYLDDWYLRLETRVNELENLKKGRK
jgi:hypothetical protein